MVKHHHDQMKVTGADKKACICLPLLLVNIDWSDFLAVKCIVENIMLKCVCRWTEYIVYTDKNFENIVEIYFFYKLEERTTFMINGEAALNSLLDR